MKSQSISSKLFLLFFGLALLFSSPPVTRVCAATFIVDTTAEDDLYHLAEDSYELVNLAANSDYDAVKQDLKARLKAQLIAWEDPLAKHVFFRESDLWLIGK